MVKVTPITQYNEDDRGSNYIWNNHRTGDLMLCYRNAGSSSGQHYHEGRSEYKNPEIIYLVSGKAEMHWCPVDGHEIVISEMIAPCRVEVPAMVWHQQIAITDISYIELNSIEDVQRDSIRIWREDFEKMIKVKS